MLVVDASVSAVWIFDDEDDALADEVAEFLKSAAAFVPPLWRYEMRNALLMAAKRGRLALEALQQRLDVVEAMPIVVDGNSDLSAALEIAEVHELTFYDALYLELAARRACALASLDKAMNKAAKAMGIDIFRGTA